MAQQPLPFPPPPALEAEETPSDPQNLATQPFGTAPNLPPGYQPSHSAIDPVESPEAPAGENPGASALPPEEIAPAAPEPEILRAKPDPRSYTAVILQGLDKVTARRQQFEAMMGTVTSFGNLEIVPRACWQSPPEDRKDAAALLEIWQWKPGEKPSFVFFGWMFASSPALSSLEHPVYDLTVLSCKEDPKSKAERLKKEKAEQKKQAQEEKAQAPLAPPPPPPAAPVPALPTSPATPGLLTIPPEILED
jgi:hypothetical protein